MRGSDFSRFGHRLSRREEVFVELIVLAAELAARRLGGTEHDAAALAQRRLEVSEQTKITPSDVVDWAMPERSGVDVCVPYVDEMAVACWLFGLLCQAWLLRPHQEEPHRAGRKATATLRRVLPTIISSSERRRDQARTTRLRLLLNAAEAAVSADFAASLGLPRNAGKNWRLTAKVLAPIYDRMMVRSRPAGWSRKGPAVKFLARALERIYPGENITLAAIEHAIAAPLPKFELPEFR
jgi:hypothetical protein